MIAGAGRTLLITGGRGMLATDVASAASARGYRVMAVAREQLDITQRDGVRELLRSVRPDIVVNTPGLMVDACEAEPEQGYRVHAWAPGMMAQECDRLGATIVYLSTCGLFGDELRSYSEYDPVKLKTAYARSKYVGEMAVQQACHRALVIRPGWLFGGTASHRRNFVYQRYLEAARQSVVRSASDTFGSPTYTVDVARALLDLVEAEVYGTYHLTNEGGASRYEYVKRIVEVFGLSTVVEPVDSTHFPRRAPVPVSEMLACVNLRFTGIPPLGPWQEAVERCAKRLKQEGALAGAAV